MLSLSRIGPLITAAYANEFVELISDGVPDDAIARTTGKYSGLQPAITALIATCRTLYDHGGYAPPAILPTISSGLWLVPFSISSTSSSVGMMTGRKSVMPRSEEHTSELQSQ